MAEKEAMKEAFNFGTANILVITELVNRGMSFLQAVDTIISFEPCHSEEEEAVRISSNKDGAECSQFAIQISYWKTFQMVWPNYKQMSEWASL